MHIQKPFLKWVGGKTQIIHHVIEKFPSEMNNYHEPFVGGGAVLLALLSLQKEGKVTVRGKIYAYDINPILINLYKWVQTNPDGLHRKLSKYMDVYDGLNGTVINRKPKSIEEAMTSKESYFYWVRELFNKSNKSTLDCAAMFMYINKTCFRGMYREGPSGYNVPYGHYKKTPSVISLSELRETSRLLQGVVFCTQSYSKTLRNIASDDFVYLDPPYVPENSKSFVGYVSDGFTIDMHKELFEMTKECGAKFLMSNAKTKLILDTFRGFTCTDVVARRAINSKNPQSTVTEILIYN